MNSKFDDQFVLAGQFGYDDGDLQMTLRLISETGVGVHLRLVIPSRITFDYGFSASDQDLADFLQMLIDVENGARRGAELTSSSDTASINISIEPDNPDYLIVSAEITRELDISISGKSSAGFRCEFKGFLTTVTYLRDLREVVRRFLAQYELGT